MENNYFQIRSDWISGKFTLRDKLGNNCFFVNPINLFQPRTQKIKDNEAFTKDKELVFNLMFPIATGREGVSDEVRGKFKKAEELFDEGLKILEGAGAYGFVFSNRGRMVLEFKLEGEEDKA